MDKKELIELLKDAQCGQELAQDRLLVYIRDHIMYRRISRYLGKNRQVDNEDIKQEFMIGVALNIHRAELNIGDPIEYLIACGVYRVRSYMKKQIIKGTTQTCNKCGYVSRLNMEDGKYKCKKCGSNDITTQEMHNLDDGTTLNTIESMEEFEAELMFNMLMDEFEATLNKNTNVYQLYILIKGGINRNNPQVKNYIKEIADIWHCSQNNIVQTMSKLKDKLIQFANDRDMDIVDYKFVERSTVNESK